jgi:hypothetical protein
MDVRAGAQSLNSFARSDAIAASMLNAVLDQYEFARGDYGRAINAVVYSEDKATAFNLTGYTVNIRILDTDYSQILQDIEGTITLAASGTLSFTLTENNTWPVSGIHFVEIELTQSGKVISVRPVRVTVYASPA